jgi:DNA invertase Pin-like site-specific DNA recombinase
MKRIAIYLRVSTSKQETSNQRRKLEAVAARSGWQIVKVYEDAGISGAKGRDKRPGLDAMMKAVNAREFDLVAAWSVDRLGRSLTDLLAILQGLHEKGVDLFLHQQGLDTSTTAGKAMFQMLGVFAEFERGIIRERVNAGLARARANGIKLGRRPVKPAVEARIRQLRAKGDGILKIGRTLGRRYKCRATGRWRKAIAVVITHSMRHGPAVCSGSLLWAQRRFVLAWNWGVKTIPPSHARQAKEIEPLFSPHLFENVPI